MQKIQINIPQLRWEIRRKILQAKEIGFEGKTEGFSFGQRGHTLARKRFTCDQRAKAGEQELKIEHSRHDKLNKRGRV